MNYVFRGKDHPEANGRQAQNGDESFPMFFGTEDGGRVTILLGRAGFVNIASCILRGLEDDPALKAEVTKAMDEVNVGPIQSIPPPEKESPFNPKPFQ